MLSARLHPQEGELRVDPRPVMAHEPARPAAQPWRGPSPRWSVPFFLACLGGAGVAQWLALVPGTGISLWLPGGVCLAALLLSARRSWAGWLALACLAEVVANALWFGNRWGVALLLTSGNALTALAGAWLLQPRGAAPFQLEDARSVMRLLTAGAVAAPVIGALVGALTLGWTEGQPHGRAFLLWWVGDASGVLIAAPLVLALRDLLHGGLPRSLGRGAEAVALIALLVVAGLVSLGGGLPFAYLVIPALLWAAVRFEFSGGAAAILILSAMTAHFTVTGQSPFSGEPPAQARLSVMLQLYLGISATLAWLVAGLARQNRLAMDALRSANAELEQKVALRTADLTAAARQKDVFLAVLAHELRNPLTPILHAAQVLRRAGSDPALRERMCSMVERQARHLSRLVDDLLDVARVAEGKLELRLGRIDLRDVAQQALEGAQAAADARGHTLVCTVPAAPVVVEGDGERLQRCIGNLLLNAIKYTDPGGRIEVCVRPGGPDAPADAPAQVEVTDNGPGLAPEHLPRVFDEFYQVVPGGKTAATREGLGLGLALVRRLVQMHGGCVKAHSDGLGRGCRFTIELPAIRADARQAGA